MVDLSRFRRRHQQQLRYYDKPARERHFLSLVASVLSIIMLVLALSLPEWAKGRVSQCDFVFGLTQVRYQDSNAHTQNVESSEFSQGRGRGGKEGYTCAISVYMYMYVEACMVSRASLGMFNLGFPSYLFKRG